MEFDLYNSIGRGNFILSKNGMKEYFGNFPNLVIRLVGKYKEPLINVKEYHHDVFSIHYHDDEFHMWFKEIYEKVIDDKLQEKLKKDFIENIIPKIIEFLNNPNPPYSFYVRHQKGRLVIHN